MLTFAERLHRWMPRAPGALLVSAPLSFSVWEGKCELSVRLKKVVISFFLIQLTGHASDSKALT